MMTRKQRIKIGRVKLMISAILLIVVSILFFRYRITGSSYLTSLLTDTCRDNIRSNIDTVSSYDTKTDKPSAEPEPITKNLKEILPIEDCVEDTEFVSNPATNRLLNLYADALGTQILTLSDIPSQYISK